MSLLGLRIHVLSRRLSSELTNFRCHLSSHLIQNFSTVLITSHSILPSFDHHSPETVGEEVTNVIVVLPTHWIVRNVPEEIGGAARRFFAGGI